MYFKDCIGDRQNFLVLLKLLHLIIFKDSPYDSNGKDVILSPAHSCRGQKKSAILPFLLSIDICLNPKFGHSSVIISNYDNSC